MRSIGFEQEPIIDFRLLRSGELGEQFENLVRRLGEMLGLEVEWSGRGADDGRDLVFVDNMKGSLGVDRVRWLVQCKDHAKSGKSVRASEIGSILDRVRQHRATGYLLATTTIPSTGVKKLLDDLDISSGGPIRTWVWDGTELRKLLRMDDAREIALDFFPKESPDLVRVFHGMMGRVSGLAANNRLIWRTIQGAVDPEIQASVRETLDRSAAILKDLRYQLEVPSLVGRAIRFDESFVLNRDFFEGIVRSASQFAQVSDEPPIALKLNWPAQPIGVRASRVVIEHAIHEIIDNAVRYRKPGEQPLVAIDCMLSDGTVSIAIEDRGIGIDPSDVGHIFQPGYRGPAAQRLSIRGAGLGLSNARTIVREFGGDISLDQKPDATRLVIKLVQAGKAT